MRAPLDYPALVKDIDDVGLLDCAETVRDRDGGPALGGLVQRRLDNLFTLAVKGRGCLIEEPVKVSLLVTVLCMSKQGQGKLTESWDRESTPSQSQFSASVHQTAAHPCYRRPC